MSKTVFISSEFSFRYYLRKWQAGYTPITKDSDGNIIRIDDGKNYFQSNNFYTLNTENLICLDILMINQTFTGTFSTCDSDNLNDFTKDLEGRLSSRQTFDASSNPKQLIDASLNNISSSFDIAIFLLEIIVNKMGYESLPDMKCEEDIARYLSRNRLQYKTILDNIPIYLSYKTNMKDISKSKKSKFRKFLFENTNLTFHYAIV